jgi:hypothetical protein
MGSNIKFKLEKSPFIPLFQSGSYLIPLYQEGIEGCVPLFGKEGLGEIF